MSIDEDFRRAYDACLEDNSYPNEHRLLQILKRVNYHLTPAMLDHISSVCKSQARLKRLWETRDRNHQYILGSITCRIDQRDRRNERERRHEGASEAEGHI